MTGFFSLLFSNLNQEKIPYIVLRNYDDLPEKPLAGSDVDLLIDKKDKDNYFSIVKKTALETKTFILLKSDRSNCLSFFVYQTVPFTLGIWLDAFTEMSSKSFVWADGYFLLKHGIFNEEKKFFTLSKGEEAATIFLKEVFSGSFIKERYRIKIPDFISIDKESFIRTVEPYFGEKTAKEMADICLKKEWKKIRQKRILWFSRLMLRNFFYNPLKQIIDLFRFILGYLRWQLCQKGISVAIIGPDGVGKTTVSQELKKDLNDLFFRRIYQYHGHFGFFPEWGKVYRWLLGGRKKGKEESPRKEKKISFLRAFLSLFYYGLEHFLAWPWIIYLKSRSSVVIFDRFFYDFVTLNTGSKIVFDLFWIISRLIHRPDLVFILQAKPETIFSRKKELSLEEIKRQDRVFKDKRMSNLTSVIFIDGGMLPEQISTKIKEEILKKISERYE